MPMCDWSSDVCSSDLSSLAHFLIGSFIFLELSCRSCLYIFEINCLSFASFAIIFSHSESPCAHPWLWLDVHKPRGCGFPIPAPGRSSRITALILAGTMALQRDPRRRLIPLLLQRSTSECWTLGGWPRPEVRLPDLCSFQMKCGAASNRRPEIKP